MSLEDSWEAIEVKKNVIDDIPYSYVRLSDATLADARKAVDANDKNTCERLAAFVAKHNVDYFELGDHGDWITVPEFMAGFLRKVKITAVGNEDKVGTLVNVNMKKFESVSLLDVSRNGLYSLPEKIGQLTVLSHLDLRYNKLTTLPEQIGLLTALSDLNLRSNKLNTLPEHIGQLTALRHLDLHSNKLPTLPEQIGQLTALSHLDLSCNVLTTLPEQIGQLTALSHLVLHSNKLATLPEQIGHLTALSDLVLINNKLTTLPEQIGQLTALSHLELRLNKLTTLPEHIGQLTALSHLKLSSNGLITLPEQIGRLTAISHLDLGYNKLINVPEEIGQMSALSDLDLSYTELTTLPEKIFQCAALFRLQLSNNKLTNLPEQIGQLTALSNLSVSDNKLSSLPEQLGQLTALSYLNVGSNKLTSLPEQIGQLTALSHLDLRVNKLNSLPEQIGQLTALSNLSASDNELTTLPEQIGQLTALSHLGLDNNELTTLPEQIGQLTALSHLGLDNNELTTLPEQIGQLTALSRLYLRYNQLTSLPEQIVQLTALSRLELNENELTILPEQIGQLTALSHLELRLNKLTTLPEQVGRLTALSRLGLSDNKLTTFPEQIGQLTALSHLGLDNNELTTLPEQIGQLTALFHLNLSGNKLTTLPEQIGRLTALSNLVLENNELTTLPEQIGQLASLSRLDLRYNQLTSLPEQIGQLTALSHLDLRRNELTTLPVQVVHLTAISALYLSYNKLTTLPSIFHLLGAHDVKIDIEYNPLLVHPPASLSNDLQMAYLKESYERSVLVSSRGPVLVLGSGGAGKTTLKLALSIAFDRTELHDTIGSVRQSVEQWKRGEFQEWFGELADSLGVPRNSLPGALLEFGTQLVAVNGHDAVYNLFQQSAPLPPLLRDKIIEVARTLRCEPEQVRDFTALTRIPHVWTEGVAPSSLGDQVIWDFAGQLEFFPAHRMHLLESGAHFVLVCDSRKSLQFHVDQLILWLNFFKSMVSIGAQRQQATRTGDRPKLLVVMTHSDLVVGGCSAARQLGLSALAQVRSQFNHLMDLSEDPFVVNYGEPFMGGDLCKLLSYVRQNPANRSVPKVYEQFRCRLAEERRKLAGGAPIMKRHQFDALLNDEIPHTSDPALADAIVMSLVSGGEIRVINEFVVLDPMVWLTRILARLLHPKHKYVPQQAVERGTGFLSRSAVQAALLPEPVDEALSLLEEYRLCVKVQHQSAVDEEIIEEYVVPSLLTVDTDFPAWFRNVVDCHPRCVMGRRYRVADEQYEALAPGLVAALQVAVAREQPDLLHLSGGQVLGGDRHGNVFRLQSTEMPVSHGFSVSVFGNDQTRCREFLDRLSYLVGQVWSGFPGVLLRKYAICPACLLSGAGQVVTKDIELNQWQCFPVQTVMCNDEVVDGRGAHNHNKPSVRRECLLLQTAADDVIERLCNSGAQCKLHHQVQLEEEEMLYGNRYQTQSVFDLSSPAAKMLARIDMRHHPGFILGSTVLGFTFNQELAALSLEQQSNAHDGASASDYQLVPVPSDDRMFETVESFLLKSLVNGLCKVINVDLIVQPQLVRRYARRLEELTGHSPRLTNARLLFHYTRPTVLGKICRDGCNTAFCKEKGAWFGQGVYFSQFLEYGMSGYAWKMCDVRDPSAGRLLFRFGQRERRKELQETLHVREIVGLTPDGDEMRLPDVVVHQNEPGTVSLSADQLTVLFQGQAVFGPAPTPLMVSPPYYEVLLCQVLTGHSVHVTRQQMEDQLCNPDTCGGPKRHQSHEAQNEPGVPVEIMVPVRERNEEHRDPTTESQILPRFVVRFVKRGADVKFLFAAGKPLPAATASSSTNDPVDDKNASAFPSRSTSTLKAADQALDQVNSAFVKVSTDGDEALLSVTAQPTLTEHSDCDEVARWVRSLDWLKRSDEVADLLRDGGVDGECLLTDHHFF